jgi:hypothetical protein
MNNYHHLSKLETSLGFRRGSAVRFNPPPGAYSKQSKQAKCAGQRGSIIGFQGDSYATIRFNRMDCLCNLAYCED